MRFKLVKRYLKHSFETVFLFAFIGASLPEARATITISPANGGSISPPTTQGGAIYYYAGVTAPGRPPNGFFEGNSNPALNISTDVIRLNVSTNVPISVTPPQVAVVTYYVSGNATQPQNGPISNCISSTCMAQSGVRGYTHAATFDVGTGGTIQIDISIPQICDDANNNGTPLSNGICTGPMVNTTGTFWSLPLTFSVLIAPDRGFQTQPTTQSLDTMSGSVTLYFNSSTSTFSCPSSTDMNSNFFPGDGQIYLNTNIFRLGPPSNGIAPPLSNLYVVGLHTDNQGTLPDTSSNFRTMNSLVSTAPINNQAAPVGGFQNSTEAIPIRYNLSFIAQDQTGIFFPPSDPAACNMGPVMTADIQGFLPSGTKNCFIATATFQSSESPPVLMLREFRDQILLKNRFGRKFVNWYYSWSPKAADWLSDHPLFRFSALLLLFPLEGLAWLSLHPFILSIIMVVWGLLVTLFVVLRVESERRKTE